MKGSVKVKDRTWRSKLYPCCFVGKFAVKWFCTAFSLTKEEAIKIGKELQKAGFFDHVMKEHEFKNQYLYYRFKEDQEILDKELDNLGTKRKTVVLFKEESEDLHKLFENFKKALASIDELDLFNPLIFHPFVESCKNLIKRASEDGNFKVDFDLSMKPMKDSDSFIDSSYDLNESDDFFSPLTRNSNRTQSPFDKNKSLHKELKKFHSQATMNLLQEENLELKRKVENIEDRSLAIDLLSTLSSNKSLIKLQDELNEKNEKIKALEQKIEELKEAEELLNVYKEKNEVLTKVVEDFSQKMETTHIVSHSKEIIYDKENIEYISLSSLINLLVDNPNSEYSDIWFNTYCLFNLTPKNLLNIFVKNFCETREEKKWNGIANLVKNWIEIYLEEDIKKDSEFKEVLFEFAEKVISPALGNKEFLFFFKFFFQQKEEVSGTIVRRVTIAPKLNVLTVSAPMIPPKTDKNSFGSLRVARAMSLFKKSKSSDNMNVYIEKPKIKESLLSILSLNPNQFCENLILFQFNIFKNIKPTEFHHLNWTRKDKLKLAPNICKSTSYFNRIADWMLSQVLLEKETENKIKLMEILIDMGKSCIEKGAFHCGVQIFMVISNFNLTKMKSVWSQLSVNTEKNKEFLEDVASYHNNYSTLRRVTAISNPCFPYLALLLSDYLYIDELKPKYRKGLINFSKITQLSQILVFLKEAQVSSFNYKSDPFLTNLFTHCSGLKDEQVTSLAKDLI